MRIIDGVEVRASTKKLKSDLKKATAQVKSAGSKMRNSMRGAMTALTNNWVKITAAATAAFLVLRRITTEVDNIAKAARRTGFGVEKFQELAIAAELSGAQ